MRCIKENGGHRNFEERCSEYNHSIHSLTLMRSVEQFFSRNVTLTSEDMERTGKSNIQQEKRYLW